MPVAALQNHPRIAPLAMSPKLVYQRRLKAASHKGPFERHPARCSSSSWSSMSMEQLFRPGAARRPGPRCRWKSMHCFRRRSYATPFVLIEAPCFAPSSPLSRRTNHSLSFRHASAIFLQSGLHPSVHKPDMSVWTGSVFE
jgi:hypothetical protein